MTRSTHRELIRELIELSSVTKPSTQIFYVEHLHANGKCRSTYYPAVALHHRIVSIFTMKLPNNQPDPLPRLTAAELLKDGWQFVRREERFGVLYLTPRHAAEPVSSLDKHENLTDCTYESRPIDWPPLEVTA